MVFASRHPDALLLLNDAMAKAYSIGMHQADFANGLWQEVDWQEMRSVTDLERVIVEELSQHEGETRINTWLRIVQKHFAIYLHKEYRAAIQHLAEEKRLIFISNTGRLNDEAKLYLASPTLL